MAKVVIGAEVKVDGLDKAGQSVGSFKKQLKEAKEDLIQLSDKFGNTSEQALNAARRVAELRDKMKDAKETSDLFDPGRKFSAFGNVLQTVTAGFSTLTGAMGLFGAKGEEIQAVLLKVQSAMLLQQGLSAIADAQKDFTRLSAIIQSTTVFQKANNAATVIAATVQRAFGVAVDSTAIGFKALKAAIIATGIGALVVLIGSVISAIIDWTSSNEDLEKSQETLKKSIEETTAATDRHRHAISRATSEAIALAKAQGKSQAEIFEIQKQGALEDERLQGVKLRSLYNFYLTQKELFEKGKIEEQAYLDAKKTYTDAYSEYEDFKSQQRISLYNEEGRIRSEQEAEAKKSAERARAESEKRKADTQKLYEDLQKLRRDFNAGVLSDMENTYRELNDAADAQAAAEIERMKTNQLNELQTKAELAELALLDDPDSIINKLAKTEADFALEMAQFEGNNLQRQIKEKEHADAIVRIKQEEADAKKKIEEETLVFQNYVVDQVANGLDTLADIAGKQTAAGKVLAIASTTIKTIQGGIAAFTGMVSNIPGPVGIALGVVAAAGVVASGVKAISQITAVKVPRGGSAGGGAPNLALPNAPIRPQAESTRLDQQSINAVGNAAARSYVLESDVSGNQDKIRRLNRAARIN